MFNQAFKLQISPFLITVYEASLNTFVLDILNMLYYYKRDDCFLLQNEF